MMPDTALLHPGVEVTDDRVPGKVGRVVAVIDSTWARIQWEYPATSCAKFYLNEERADLLSLKE